MNDGLCCYVKTLPVRIDIYELRSLDKRLHGRI